MSSKHYVTMTDRFMSNWGKAEGKKNKLVISCYSYSEALTVKENAENRSDMTDIKIMDELPTYDETKFYVDYHGREQGSYDSWFKSGWFKPEPKMTKRQVEDAQRNFMNIAKVFTEPTGTINQKLHNDAVTERLIRFVKLQNAGVTAKQIEEITFKLTDAEKLSILSEASLKAPLDQQCTDEMERLFYKVYGEENHNAIFGNRAPPEQPEWVNIWGNK